MPKEALSNQCEAITRGGGRCRNAKAHASMFCQRHALGSPRHASPKEGHEESAHELERVREEHEPASPRPSAVPDTVDVAQESARWPHGRDLPRAEIARIMEEHRLWRQSEGKQGKRGDLSYANLFMQTADDFWFPYGNLRGARFMGSSLRHAVLSNADLRGASLNDADLRDASLWEADLRGAYLRNTKLAGAALNDADMSGAVMDGAVLESEEKSSEDLDHERREIQVEVL